MKKISITPYKVQVRKDDGTIAELPYNVRESLIEILFSPTLKLRAAQLVKQQALAEKIQKSGDDLLLEDEEYGRLETAINSMEGLGRSEVELVQRILNAPTVDVEAK